MMRPELNTKGGISCHIGTRVGQITVVLASTGDFKTGGLLRSAIVHLFHGNITTSKRDCVCNDVLES